MFLVLTCVILIVSRKFGRISSGLRKWFWGGFEASVSGGVSQRQVLSIRGEDLCRCRDRGGEIGEPEGRMETLVMEHESWEEYNKTKSIYSLANMYLHSQADFDYMQVEMFNALGWKCGILNNEWAESRLSNLYIFSPLLSCFGSHDDAAMNYERKFNHFAMLPNLFKVKTGLIRKFRFLYMCFKLYYYLSILLK